MTRQGLQQRLAAWADSRLLPVGLAALLVGDIGLGLNWLTAHPENLTAPAYRVAKLVLPMDTYGVLFILAGLVAAGLFLWRGRGWPAGYAVGGALAGMWLYWTVVYALAPLGITKGVSFAGALYAGVLCVLHLLFGLALTHLPRRTERG